MQEWEPYRPSFSDRELGMDRRISRRDFFDGIAVMATAAGLAGCSVEKTARNASGRDQNGAPAGGWADRGQGNPAYPPAMTGLRGSTNAALRVPHELRDGSYWSGRKDEVETEEVYDLVVVGAGISGLSAAYFYRRKHPGAKILVLDNHDDFGGHARRDEFSPDGKLIIGYGGSQSIEGPSVWSGTARGLLADLGVDVKKFDKYYDQDFNKRWKLTDSEFFNKESFGRDHLAKATEDGVPTAAGLANAPIAAKAKADILMINNNPGDFMPGLTDAEKKNRLVEMTYKQYLADVAKVHPDVVRYMQTYTSDEWGYGIDAFGALDAWAEEYPGFQGLKIDNTKPDPRCIKTIQIQWDEDDPYIYHFPEGNNALCKLMIGRMIPGTGAPATMDTDPLARIDYSRLDVAANDVRVRLNSPVVEVRHVNDDPATKTVRVRYEAPDGKVHSVTAGGAVLACYNTMIPFIAPELTGDQKQALQYGIKLPIIYAMVQLRNWQAWHRLGIFHTRFTGPYWQVAELDYPVSMGGYEFSEDPSQPILVHMIRMATAEGENPRGGILSGRRALYQTPFEYYERRSATSSPACSARAASTPPATSRASRSTAGAMATPWSTRVRGRPSGPPDRSRTRSARSPTAASPSPTPTPRPAPTPTPPSTRPPARSPSSADPPAADRSVARRQRAVPPWAGSHPGEVPAHLAADLLQGAFGCPGVGEPAHPAVVEAPARMDGGGYARLLQPSRERLALRAEPVELGQGEQGRREGGQVGGQQRGQARVGGVGAGDVGVEALVGAAGREGDAVGVGQRIGKDPQVQSGIDQRQTAGPAHPAQQAGHRDLASCGLPGDADLVEARQRPADGALGVVDRRRIGMFGSEAVVDRQEGDARCRDQGPDHGVVGLDVADHPAAPVEVDDDRAVVPALRAVQPRRDPSGVDIAHLADRQAGQFRHRPARVGAHARHRGVLGRRQLRHPAHERQILRITTHDPLLTPERTHRADDSVTSKS
ncbi:hypothetical protein GCM10010468_29000 [Actinocorallia longicatena]|uniref:Uncharacterized protein n=1 Tax=Actinocorallia longicatena TaxID=111803 RepID=A0ABP6QE13_9ACTN